jgi:hypothetical protein
MINPLSREVVMPRAKAKRKPPVLKQVYDLARRDPVFLAAVIRDPKKALQKKGKRLSDKDLEKLKKWLEKLLIATLTFLMSEMKGKVYPWP